MKNIGRLTSVAAISCIGIPAVAADYTVDIPVSLSHLPDNATAIVDCVAFVNQGSEPVIVGQGVEEVPGRGSYEGLVTVLISAPEGRDPENLPTFSCRLRIGDVVGGIPFSEALSWERCLEIGYADPRDHPHECAARGALTQTEVNTQPGVLSETLLFTGQSAGVFLTVDARANASTGGGPVDTDVNVISGYSLRISVDPEATWTAGPNDGACSRTGTADGLDVACFGMWTQDGFTAPYGALVGRIGSRYFLVGTSFDQRAPDSGVLRLYYWDSHQEDNVGTIDVQVQVTRPE